MVHTQDYMRMLWDTLYPVIVNRMGPIKGRDFLKRLLRRLQYSSDITADLAAGKRFMILHYIFDEYYVWTGKTGTKQEKL